MSFENKILVLSSLTIFISLLDVNIVMISYPVIAKVFNVNLSGVAIVSISFLMTLAISMPISGRVNDLIGVKNTILIGYVIVIVSGFMCGVSESLNQLAFFRAIQGVGAALLSIASTSMIILYIPAHTRGKAFGVLATSGAVGLTLGAPIGGVLTGYFGWESIFFSIIPFALFTALLSYRVVPSVKEVLSLNDIIKNFDFTGAALISFGIGTSVYAMVSFIHTHTYHLSTIVTFTLGVAAIFFFIRYEMKSKTPLMDLSILKNRYFVLILFANMAAVVLLSMNNFIVPFYLIEKLSLSPQYAGIVMVSFSIVYGVLSPFMGRLSDKSNPYFLCLIGMILALVITILFSFVIESASVTHVVILLIGYGIAFAFFISPVHTIALGFATKKNAGSTTALFRTTRQISSLLAIVLVGILVGNISTHGNAIDFHAIIIFEIYVATLSIILMIYLLLKNR